MSALALAGVDVKTAALVGAAVGAPWLVEQLTAKEGVQIPVYVTAGQHEAMAKLGDVVGSRPTVQTEQDSAFARWMQIRRFLTPLRGTAPGNANYPNASREDLTALCDAFLAAVTAGALSSSEPYDLGDRKAIVSAEGYEAALDVTTPGISSRGVTAVLAGQVADADLSDLGRAARAVAVAQGNLGSFYDPEDQVPFLRALSELALAMDGQGYRITGAPLHYTLTDGLAAAAEFWKKAANAAKDFALDKMTDVLWAFLDMLLALGLSTPGILAIVAILYWRHHV